MTRNQVDELHQKPLKLRWLMLSFAFFATVFNYVDRLAFNYLSANGSLRELIPNDAFGYIATAFFVAYTISNLISGFVIDKLGTRLGYALSMLVWTSASLLHAFARVPLHFGICRFLLGIGEAGNWPAAIKLSSEWFSRKERATAIGLFNSGAAAGAIIAPPLIAWMAMRFEWELTFVLIGCVGYLWIIGFWFTYYTPGKRKEKSTHRTIPLLKLIRTRFVCWFTISKIFMDPVWYFITFWIGRYLVDVYGWDFKKIGWFAMIPFIASDIGNILGGLFTQYIIKKGVPISRARKIAAVSFGSLLCVSLMLGPVIITSPFMALLVLSVAGFGYAAYTANTMAFPADVVPDNAIASVWGIASVGAGIGGAIFQALSGSAIEALSRSYNYHFAYHSIFLVYGLMALIAVLIIIFGIGTIEKDTTL
ncbi:MFS transporter [Niabella aurantiaca]|uniref:MFS transporter n=1 Tax=Niabella aurantiaca TaxID=379900 RepID=UPI000363F726|nr:MFS transporter [Niabella aurantiaca]